MRRLARLALIALAGYALTRLLGRGGKHPEYSKATYRERQAMRRMKKIPA